MPRDAQGVWSPAPGIKGVPNTTVKSVPYNTFVDEMQALANETRPITAGGTGGATPAAAKVALGIPPAIVDKTGDRMDGALASKVVDHGTKGSTTEEFKYGDGNTHKVVVNGALIINPTGLTEGGVMQVNFQFTSGSVGVSGTTTWDQGGGVRTTNIADLGVILTAGNWYTMFFEQMGTVRMGRFS